MGDMVTLVSCDGVEFDVEVAVASLSENVKFKILNAGVKGRILLDVVNGASLGRVVDYCKYHIQCERAGASEGQRVPENLIASWEDQFVSVLDWQELIDLHRAAKHMDIRKLRDLTSGQIAHSINRMSNDDIKTNFNVPDFNTDAAEKRVRSALILIWSA